MVMHWHHTSQANCVKVAVQGKLLQAPSNFRNMALLLTCCCVSMREKRRTQPLIGPYVSEVVPRQYTVKLPQPGSCKGSKQLAAAR